MNRFIYITTQATFVYFPAYHHFSFDVIRSYGIIFMLL